MQTHVASDGLKLRYAADDYSDPWRPQETVFLLHAAMGSSRRLYKWVPILARDFRVVRPDMRGHGQTEIPGSDQRVKRLAMDVAELADALGCKQFHVAGSSAGAIVAMQVAIDYPDRVKTLGDFASTPGSQELAGRCRKVDCRHPGTGLLGLSRSDDRRPPAR